MNTPEGVVSTHFNCHSYFQSYFHCQSHFHSLKSTYTALPESTSTLFSPLPPRCLNATPTASPTATSPRCSSPA